MHFSAPLPALAAAILFGASTPFAKLLVGEMSPLLLAGIMYLGSGLGLALLLAVRRLLRRGDAPKAPELSIPRAEMPSLAGAVIAGLLGPVLLMTGLTHAYAASRRCYSMSKVC